MKLQSFALALALAGLATGTSAPSAKACGPFAARDQAARMVTQHFNALNAHDRERVLSLWTPTATVVSGTPSVIEPIGQAATRWLAGGRTLTFTISKIDSDPDDQYAVAHVNVRRDGVAFEEAMLVAPTQQGWRIVGETSRWIREPAQGHY